jgi:chromosome segregation ATPase
VGYVIYSNWETFVIFFTATLAFNVATLSLMTIGTIFIIGSGVNLVMLGGTFGALAYKKSGFDFYLRSIETIMPAHIAHMFYSRKTKEKLLFTQEESREVIDWLEDSFHKQKSYISFFINTPLLIGLFGTFTGLLTSIDDMGKIVVTLGSGSIELGEVIRSFAGPLSGMAVGFGSSLFAVGVATLLGIKGYILFKYQDILIAGVETWLKDRIVDMNISSSEEGELPEHRESFLDVFLDQMNSFTKELSKIGDSNQALAQMALSLENLNSKVDEERAEITKISKLLETSTQNSVSKIDSINTNILSIGDVLKSSAENYSSAISSMSNNLKSIEQKSDSTRSDIATISEHMSRGAESTAESINRLTDVIKSENAVVIDTLQGSTQSLSSLKASFEGVGSSITQSIESGNKNIEDGLKEINKNSNLFVQIVERSDEKRERSLVGINESIQRLNSHIDSNKDALEMLHSLQKEYSQASAQNQERFLELIGDIGQNIVDMKNHLGENTKLEERKLNEFKDHIEMLKSELIKIQGDTKQTNHALKTLSQTAEKTSKENSKTSKEIIDTIKSSGDTNIHVRDSVDEGNKKLGDIIEKLDSELKAINDLIKTTKSSKSTSTASNDENQSGGFFKKIFK